MLLACVALAATPTRAQPAGADRFDGSARVGTTIELARDEVAPGETVWATIRMDHDDGWHTYWPGRSDTGMGTRITFTPIEGLSFGDPIWPTPDRYLAPGDILDHVYDERAEIHVPIRVRDGVDPVQALRIEARVSFLVCEAVCLPGEDAVATSLRIVPPEHADDRASDPPARHPQLEQSHASWDGSAVTIRVEDAERYEFYPAMTCSDLEDLIRDGAQSGPSCTIRFGDDAEPRLSGRLRVVHRDGRESHFDVDLTPNP